MANYDAELLLINGQGLVTVTYYMRGYDQTHAQIVFWTANLLDTTGSEYTGPGPLTDIVWLRAV